MKIPQKLLGWSLIKKVIAHPLFSKVEELFVYGIVGGLTTVISFSSYAFFTRILHLEVLVSDCISFVLAATFAFFANKHAVFHSKSKNYIKEIILFFAMRLASQGFSVAMMYIGVYLLHIYDLAVKVISLVVIVILNYVFSKFIIFKNPDTQEVIK
jgi:putative flippase GtrA